MKKSQILVRSSNGSLVYPLGGDTLLAVAVADPLEPFLLLGLVLGGLTLALLLWQRRRHRKTLEHRMRELREQMAQDFHDELGSKLTVITLYGELARQALDERKPQASIRAYISKALEASHQLYSSMKDLIWTLKPASGLRENVWHRMEHNGRDLFSDTGMEFAMEVQEEIKGLPLSPTARKDLLLLVKEAFHNARRHAAANRVGLTACLRHGELHIVIEDDGRGFDPANVESGEGLRNMRMRAGRLGGRLDFFSSGQGTRVQLCCPLEEG